ncbi:MAG: flippase-like domain-containing protein [Deltaproteobacteria bacterium]|nr:flippase-like domain-containing protein [Deltaproteobacteria bacterium]
MKKGIAFTVILVVIAFTSLGLWGDIHKAGAALKNFPWYLLPLIALFGFANDLIKFFRWNVYLKKLDIHLPIAQSLGIFVSGLSMSATPGKVGFLIKSQMLKNLTGRTLITSSPVILAELYMDFIALSLISVFGIGMIGSNIWLVLILCTIPLCGLIPGVPELAAGLIAKIPFFSHKTRDLRSALDDMFALFGPKVLWVAFIITLAAWASEGIALSLIVKGLGFDMGIIQATVIFGFSTLIGVISMLPGGLVVTDASLMGLILHAGIPATPAALAAIMARIFTLWLAVLIGSVVLVINRRYMYSLKKEGIA